MCGIAGAIWMDGNRGSAEAVRIAVGAMSAALAHRGPDDKGLWQSEDGRICLAQRRLAIVDLSPRGHQPMAASDGATWITFNGEIYNFRTLRRQLIAAGYAFRSETDTEVVLAAYQIWGLERALVALEGMFAFALWDGNTRTLHLARDRAGEKPLFLGRFGECLYFASELRAFRAVPGLTLSPNRRSVGAFLAYGYVPAPHSMFQNVVRLEPGTSLSLGSQLLFGRANGDLQVNDLLPKLRRYWSSNEVAAESGHAPVPTSVHDVLDELESLLLDVVKNQLACDVPVGVFLSGGIDSSLVAALAQRVASQSVGAYTIAFDDVAFDESRHAAAVAAHLGMQHEILPLSSAEIVAAVPELAARLDEPTANTSYFPVALMSRLARRRVTVVLSGDGGDEVFCGYNRYRQLDALSRLTQWIPSRLVRQGIGCSLGVFARQSAANGLSLKSMPQVLPAEAIARAGRFLAAGDFAHGYDATMRLFDGTELLDVGDGGVRFEPSSDGARDRLLAMMSADFLHYLPDDNLAKVDRAAMLSALEVRLPLLSHRVVERSWRLGRSFWLQNGRSKWVLRQLLMRYVPPALFERPKMGFTVPVREWLADPLRAWSEDSLHADALTGWLGIPSDFVERERQAMRKGVPGSARRVWSLVMLGAWGQSNRSSSHVQ
jgi:asparagine synthase (glutamine-hydrolysing)